MNPYRQPLNRHRHYTVAPRTWVPGEMVTAGMMNSIRDNLVEVGNKVDTGAISIPGMAYGDMIIAQSAAQLGRVAPVVGKLPRYDSGVGWNMVNPTAGEHDTFIGAAGMIPTVGASVPCGYHETLYTGYGNFTALPFSGTLTQQCSFSVEMPRSWDQGPIYVTLFVANKSGAAGNSYWTIYNGFMTHWGVMSWNPANGRGLTVAAPQAAYYLQYVEMVWFSGSNSPYGPTVGTIANFLVQRVAAAAEDTHQDFLYLIGARVIIKTTKDTDG